MSISDPVVRVIPVDISDLSLQADPIIGSFNPFARAHSIASS